MVDLSYPWRLSDSHLRQVGLVKEKEKVELSVFPFLSCNIHHVTCNRAYKHYLAIDSYRPETRNMAAQFKRTFCWEARTHFMGLWCADSLHTLLTP